ncbi:MAG: phenylalanyl-tRNA synthetase beta chain [Patescibacteria group bacterium]|nr:phenylalanyl-tRNA synthetase beta chain [Patescibacteria group bacterium]
MIVSLNWLKQLTDIDIPIKDLATLIGARLVEIEDVVDLGVKYKNVIIVKVISAEKLKDSDHLSVVKIDDGGITQDVERDDQGYIQVVCGAPNIKTDQFVVWLPPKSIVPETYNSTEPFVLSSRKLRGVMSNGMIASARELDLFDEHDGILELDVNVAKPGTPFATVYELNDCLLDIENKSLTHRPDCFGIIGFAREVAAIQDKKFKTPDWLLNLEPDLNDLSDKNMNLSVAIDDSSLSDRYQAIVMSGVDASKKSPLQVQTYLARVGIRPINAVVDVTNYLMLLTGQPLHAFDYDKLVAVAGDKPDIHVRAGYKDEKLELLDGRIINLTTEDIVIAAGKTAIGLAGAMGGANTEIDNNTKNIIIESATFNLYNLRSTQMRHGIFSEAITRFTKGQPADLTAPVLAAAVHLMSKWSGAICASNVAEAYPVNQTLPIIEFTANLINNILGSEFDVDNIINILENVEFKIEREGETIKATVPYWRADIHIVEDIAEEIGRLTGFDNINPTLPRRNFVAVRPTEFDDFRKKLRKILVRAGANEVLTHSFVHNDILQKANQDSNNSYRIANSISPSLQYYRQTLTPSLLNLVNSNIRQGYENFALFEINKSHKKQDGMTNENVPVESEMLALTIANKNTKSGASYYQAKKFLDYLCKTVGLSVTYKPVKPEMNEPLSAPFEYRRSAIICDRATESQIGIVGEYRKSVTKGFKLPEYVAGFEIDVCQLFDACRDLSKSYKPLSRYPVSYRDICLQVSNDVNFNQIINNIEDTLDSIDLETEISPVDIYQAKDNMVKNITIRIKLFAYDHTLTSDEVAEVINKVVDSAVVKINAKVI